MEPSYCVGRKVQKHILKSLFSAALGRGASKGKESAAVTPRLFLFEGENGTGKSTMVNVCLQNIAEIAEESGKPVASMALDLDAWRYKNGMVPKTPKAMLDALLATTAGTFENSADLLDPFNQIRGRILEVENALRYYTVIEWPREVFMNGREDSAASGFETVFRSWLEQKIDPSDYALYADSVTPLTAAFTDSLVQLSGRVPLVIVIDSLEYAALPEVEVWLKKSFFPSLFSVKNSIVCICAGAGGFVRRFRNELPEELLYPFSTAALPLSRGDITELCVRKGVTLAPEEVKEIELRTAGIPLAVQSLLDHVRSGVPVRDVMPGKNAKTPDKPDIAGLVSETVDRFVLHSEPSTKMRLMALALLYRLDENILAELWGVPGAEVSPALAAIADRYPSLIQTEKPHSAVRDLLRSYCIDGKTTKTADTELPEFVRKFASIHSTFYSQYCAHLQAEMPDAAARYADSGYQITLCGLIYSLALASQEEFEKILPGCFIEALQYHSDFAALLLDAAEEVRPLLSDSSLAMIAALKSGLAVAAELKAPVIPGRACDPKTADFMNKFSSGLSDIQEGLLHRVKGIMNCHAGKYGRAMEEFTRSETLFGPSAPELGLLFENFLCVGYAFIKSDEKKKAAEAFGKAVAIKQDDFYAWLEMAKAQQSLGDHPSAISAYSEAVRINAEAGDAWFELGNEYTATDEHGHAVEAFTRATQLEADRPAVWYNLGRSLEAVSRFPEAQKAYQQVVAMVPEHGEALFALGRSFSAQKMTKEAIDSFTAAVKIQQDCTDAWKALGMELLTVESFEKAAGALEKAAAAEQDKNDPELWHTIGRAWFGAGKFEDSVRSCRKTVELRSEYFDAWVTLGQGLIELGNFKEAHDAFSKGAELNPKDGNIWVSVGNSLYSQEKYQPAIDAYLKATELRPDTDSIWHSIGLAYQLQRKHAKAADAFQKSIDANPHVPEVWFQQGCSYAELGRNAEAGSCFSKTVELAPTMQDAWYRLALSLAKTEKHDDAVPAFIKAADINPSDAGIWYNLGLSYAATGNNAEAVKTFTQSIGIADNRPEVHYQLGRAHESLGAFEQAIPAYQKAAELQPENVEPWLHFGLCCNALARYAEAAEALRKVLELSPDNKDVFLPMALAAHAVGNYEEAVVWYRKVIDNNPYSEEAQFNCALALHALNKYDDALVVYKTVVEKWPAKDQAWYNMGLVYHAMNEFKQAIAAYREASKLNPESTDTWYQLGIVFYSTEQYGEAILAFRKVTSRRSDLYEAWYNLGNSYLIWREYSDAIAAYQKATELRPDDYTAWGYLGTACYAVKTYDKAEAACAKAFKLKSDEPWIIGTLALSKLFNGDAAGATPLFETLLAADSTGQEVAKAASEIQQALKKNPSLKGGNEALQVLAGK